MEDELPFKESYDEANQCWIRTFPGNMPSEKMKWHWDDEDRLFEIQEGDSWQFQRDNELPFPMKPGMSIKIAKGEYHRGIKPEQCEDLVIRMYKSPASN